MEKEKILQRYRQEGVDEGREEVNRRGDDAGFYAMCVLALLLMIYQAFTGQVFGDVAAMLFVFCSVVHNPIWRAISVAVPGVSPVTIFTPIPAD